MGDAQDNWLTYANPEDPGLRRSVIRSIERLSGQRGLADRYQRARERSVRASDGPRPERFFREALCELGVVVRYQGFPLKAMPRHGPLIFVANHPFGVLDGLALCELALRSRGDVKVMIHRTLFRDPDLRKYMLPIDFSGDRAAAKRNIDVRNRTVAYLREGGTVAVFPGGGIATARGIFGPVTDLEWKLLPAKLIHLTRATVVPIFFPGSNSRLFQWVSQFSETLRLSMIIRELNNKRGRSLDVAVGRPLAYSELEAFADRKNLTEHLRHKVYRLGSTSES